MGYLIEGCDEWDYQINASVTLILPAGFSFRDWWLKGGVPVKC